MGRRGRGSEEARAATVLLISLAPPPPPFALLLSHMYSAGSGRHDRPRRLFRLFSGVTFLIVPFRRGGPLRVLHLLKKHNSNVDCPHRGVWGVGGDPCSGVYRHWTASALAAAARTHAPLSVSAMYARALPSAYVRRRQTHAWSRALCSSSSPRAFLLSLLTTPLRILERQHTCLCTSTRTHARPFYYRRLLPRHAQCISHAPTLTHTRLLNLLPRVSHSLLCGAGGPCRVHNEGTQTQYAVQRGGCSRVDALPSPPLQH